MPSPTRSPHSGEVVAPEANADFPENPRLRVDIVFNIAKASMA
jgi:hypothetical protein